ncbi:hypothetical protein FH063_000408 [Azospirillum argentinense]|uniref:Uncharacterized protein n=1 Tax=Azospirillum argentinense TaxID=2970906 RepID=A0A5B0L3K2_9PROT|nr:hypothetical protein FH063_000408 [Azospirillum argentinense]
MPSSPFHEKPNDPSILRLRTQGLAMLRLLSDTMLRERFVVPGSKQCPSSNRLT